MSVRHYARKATTRQDTPAAVCSCGWHQDAPSASQAGRLIAEHKRLNDHRAGVAPGFGQGNRPIPEPTPLHRMGTHGDVRLATP